MPLPTNFGTWSTTNGTGDGAIQTLLSCCYDLCCRAVWSLLSRCMLSYQHGWEMYFKGTGKHWGINVVSPEPCNELLTLVHAYHRLPLHLISFVRARRPAYTICGGCILNTCSPSSLCSRIQFTVALLWLIWLILPCANALSMKCCLLFLLVTAVSFVSLARRTLFFMSNKNAEEYQHFHQNIFCCQASFVLWITFEYKTVLLEQEGLLMRLHCGHLLRMKCRNCS